MTGNRKKSKGARLREYRLEDCGHIIFSYKMLNRKTHVRACCYEVKASSKHAICVDIFP
jgi:hypothetical protein